MNLLKLIWHNLTFKPVTTALNIVLLALGIAVITVILLVTRQIEEKVTRNTRGVDLVVGAKGSPLQMILCNLFHVDLPTGNIRLTEAEKIARHPLVKKSIPLALGDSHAGFRIVGTTRAYPALYDGQLASGAWWQNDMEVTIGENVAIALKLQPGNEFHSTHGLTVAGGHHDASPFRVVGILKKTNSAIDNLILCSVESIWNVHDHAEVQIAGDTAKSRLVSSAFLSDSLKEITSVLLQYRSPMAVVRLPRMINEQSRLQAASPAFESARLFSMIGVGADALAVMAYILVFISALSIFIALYNSLRERRYEIAVLRTLGATRRKVFLMIVLEGLFMTAGGVLAGLALGHGTLLLLGETLVSRAGIEGIVWYPEEWIILAGSLLMGILCGLLPAWNAYRIDLHTVLAGK